MKIFVPLTITSILFISGCANSAQNQVDAQASAATLPESIMHSYECESGETIAAAYPSADTARVQYKGRSYSMQIAVSGSGARYVSDDLEWWTKGSGSGSEGILLSHLADGTSGDIIERCAVP
ncbi:MliC family protein [Halomonas sp. FME1]|uniref:MliC family protein n=1 Tax=Halomonas casei TaxID=2742613 RepID=A0ABR9F4N8_9GAMM|nr:MULTISPECIES: MliC family protein [Halomonas]MBE0401438.1 MliC family protein [Halomonas casei]